MVCLQKKKKCAFGNNSALNLTQPCPAVYDKISCTLKTDVHRGLFICNHVACFLFFFLPVLNSPAYFLQRNSLMIEWNSRAICDCLCPGSVRRSYHSNYQWRPMSRRERTRHMLSKIISVNDTEILIRPKAWGLSDKSSIGSGGQKEPWQVACDKLHRADRTSNIWRTK